MNKPVKPMEWIERHVSWQGDECLSWPFAASGGYGQVSVRGKLLYAHRLICEKAHGAAPEKGLQAAHSCGKGHLGCVNPKHLRWATARENSLDRRVHGTDPAGEKHPNSKLDIENVKKIFELSRGGMTQTNIAKLFGISQSNVHLIVRGKAWRGLVEAQV